MKRMIKAAKYKRDDINMHEYDDAVEVGKQVLSELHSRYPDEFPIGTTRSIKRRSSWSDHLYVYVDIGLTEDDIGNIDDLLSFSNQWNKIINQEILPELGINMSEFQVGIDFTSNGRHISLIVFDLSTHTDIQ